MKKPNQIIDEINSLVYPPQEAIIPQLATIRSVATSTIKVYENTEDIHSIFPNLDMMQRAIDYLRGAPLPEELRPLPEDTLKPDYITPVKGLTIKSTLNRDGEYDVSIVGVDVIPEIINPELFGDITDVTEIDLKIPVTCGKTYLVAQENPVLEYYKDDPYVMFYEPEEKWIKEKEYLMDEDFFEYAFLLQEGRSKVKISIYADYEDPIVFNITSHLHFKEKELPVPTPQPEYSGIKLTASGCRVIKNSYENGVTNYTVKGTDVDPNVKPNVELFGELDFNAVELKLHIPVECFKTYKITQYNPSLEHFKDDPNVHTDSKGVYYKEKEYMMTEDDVIDYSFIAENGRAEIRIYLQDEKGTVWKYIVNTHIHFKE